MVSRYQFPVSGLRIHTFETMGNRQLALTFAVVTALIILAYTALRMKIHIAPVVSVVVMALVYAVSSFSLILIAKKKWELDYINALIMLVSSSVVSALIIAACYRFLEDSLRPRVELDESATFGSIFIVNFFIRIPIDALAAIFRRRKS